MAAAFGCQLVASAAWFWLAAVRHANPSTVVMGFLALVPLLVAGLFTVPILRENRTLAATDSLTGLANRALVHDRLTAALAQARRTGRQVGVILIDLDRFKAINDSLGHEAGDAVLVAVANAMRSAVRSGDLAGRIGGDEFVAVLDNLPGSAPAVAVAERLLAELRTPVVFGDQLLSASASIGIAVSGWDQTGADDLLQRAGAAMDAAKNRGHGEYEVYSAELRTDARAAQLRSALARDELVVRYQIVVDPRTQRMTGVEAVPPADVSDLAVEIGSWVLRRACEETGDLPVPLFVPVSARHLSHPGLVGDVSRILRETGYDPARLVLAVPGAAVTGDHANVATLDALRGLGVRVASNGSFSNLRELRALPIDVMRLDRTFLDEMTAGGHGRTAANAVVDLARALGWQVVAVGSTEPVPLAEAVKLWAGPTATPQEPGEVTSGAE
jgi:diguanylate cyclase (GGDEF)-like protein